jgi:hypothetical protein
MSYVNKIQQATSAGSFVSIVPELTLSPPPKRSLGTLAVWVNIPESMMLRVRDI